MARERLVVIGAGVAGLAAACAARERQPASELEVVVLEAGATVGGKAATHRAEGWLVEEGPTGYLDTEPIMDRLVRIAGVEKVPANAEAARRYLVRDGVLREIRPHPLKFLASGILSPLGASRLACEPFVRGRRWAEGDDESAFDFARRRLGRQAAERLIAPMVLGVYAGDARRISLPAAFPRMAELEREHGSLVRAMMALRKARRGAGGDESNGGPAGGNSGGPAGPGGTLTSFAGGMQSFLEALAERGDFEVRTGARVEELAHDGAAWRLRVNGAAITADRVVVATEAWVASRLLADLLPDAVSALHEIRVPHVAVCALGYGAEEKRKAPTGFGALIQRGGGIRSLGVLWDSQLFAGRAPDGGVLMRAMVGGTTDPDAATLSDDELTQLVERELAQLFGLTEAPTFRHLRRWPRAIPQYELGHLDLAERVRANLARSNATRPGLALAGNYLDGVAFAKAAASGWHAERVPVAEGTVPGAESSG